MIETLTLVGLACSTTGLAVYMAWLRQKQADMQFEMTCLRNILRRLIFDTDNPIDPAHPSVWTRLTEEE